MPNFIRKTLKANCTSVRYTKDFVIQSLLYRGSTVLTNHDKRLKNTKKLWEGDSLLV